MKIAIMTDNFYPGTGGTENAVLQLAEALVDQGHDVLVCAPKYYGKYQDNFPFKVLRCVAFRGDPNNYLAFVRFSPKFRKKFESFAPDVLHCHTDAALLTYSTRYAKKHNIPLICTLHTKFSMSFLTVTRSRFVTFVLCKTIGHYIKKSTRICTVSASMREELNKMGCKEEFTVVKNGTPDFGEHVDLRELAQKKYGIKPTDNLLIFVGRIETVKNIKFIFDSLLCLNAKSVNFKMFFVGKICNKKFVKKVRKSEISDKVIFTDLITDKKMLTSLYQNAKLMLFPSIFDNDSLAIAESASCGTPSVVLQNTGSCERITDGRNGFVVENDVAKYAEKIEFLLKNPQAIEEAAVHAKTELKKDWSTTANEYVAIYKDCIETCKQKEAKLVTV